MHGDDVFLASIGGWLPTARLAFYLATFVAVAALSYLLIERTGFIIRDRFLPRNLRERKLA
jgi:hypothetical protein